MTDQQNAALEPLCPWCDSPMEPEQFSAGFAAKWACVCTNCRAIGPSVHEVADPRNERPLGRIEEAKLDAIRAATRPAPAGAEAVREALTEAMRQLWWITSGGTVEPTAFALGAEEHIQKALAALAKAPSTGEGPK